MRKCAERFDPMNLWSTGSTLKVFLVLILTYGFFKRQYIFNSKILLILKIQENDFLYQSIVDTFPLKLTICGVRSLITYCLSTCSIKKLCSTYQSCIKYRPKRGKKVLLDGLDWLSYLAGSSKTIRQVLIEL